MNFAAPIWLLVGLIATGTLALAFRYWNARRRSDLEKLANSKMLARLTKGVSWEGRIAKQILWCCALFCLFVALARPQWGFEEREVKRRGIDLVFAIDTSRSMLAEDVTPNRLERARLGILDFVERLDGDRVGLIPFAGNAFALCPLTLDYGAFRQSLEAVNTELIPHAGTDLASAVQEANRLFDEEGTNHRILILITDGEDLEGSAVAAAGRASEKGLTIHTVGVGDPAGAMIPVRTRTGRQDFIRDQNGQVVRTALDEETLEEIAKSTGGIYAPLGAGAQGLDTIYREKLRLVPKSDLKERTNQVPLEQFQWPLAIAILLLFVEFILSDRRMKPGLFRKLQETLPRATALLLFAFTSLSCSPFGDGVSEAQGSEDPRDLYNTSSQAYDSGDFAGSETTLQRSLGSTTDLDLQQMAYYNLGNARYRAGEAMLQEKPDDTIKKWEQSVKAYEDALALDSADEDAAFNRDFVKKKLEELEQQKEEQQQQEEQNEDSSEEGEEDESEEQEQQEGEDESEEQKGEESGEQGEEENQDSAKGDEGEEKEGEEESAQPQNSEQEEGQEEGQMSDERKGNEMTEEEAQELLEALKNDEQQVIPLPDRSEYRRGVPNNTTKGKTW